MTAESNTSAPRRSVGRPWPKGVSGNPGGLRRGIPGLIEKARRLALSYAPKAIERLAAMLDSEDERVVVAAAEGLLDRAGLRPYSLEPDRLEVTAVPVDVDALREALTARAASLAAVAAHALPPAVVVEAQAADVTPGSLPVPPRDGEPRDKTGGPLLADGIAASAPPGGSAR